MKSVLIRMLLALAPLLATVLFTALMMEGHVGFGGGEKDVFLSVPLLLWSLVYLVCFAGLWWRRASIGRALRLSAGAATAVVLIAWLALFGFSLLGSR